MCSRCKIFPRACVSDRTSDNVDSNLNPEFHTMLEGAADIRRSRENTGRKPQPAGTTTGGKGGVRHESIALEARISSDEKSSRQTERANEDESEIKPHGVGTSKSRKGEVRRESITLETRVNSEGKSSGRTKRASNVSHVKAAASGSFQSQVTEV